MKRIRIVDGVGGCNFKLDDHTEGFIKMMTFKQWLVSLANFVKIFYEAENLGAWVTSFRCKSQPFLSIVLGPLWADSREEGPNSCFSNTYCSQSTHHFKGSLLKPLIFNCFSKFVFILSNTNVLLVPSHCAFIAYCILFSFPASVVVTSFGVHLL